MLKITVTTIAALLLLNNYSQKVFKNENSQYGMKNSKGEVIMEANFDYMSEIEMLMPLDINFRYTTRQNDPSKIYVRVKKDDKVGLYDMNGKEILPIVNDYIQEKMSVDSVLVFRNENVKYSFIDLTSKKVITTEFNHMDPFYDGLAKITSKEVKEGYIDKTGQLIIPANFEHGSNFSNGHAVVQDGSKKGYIDNLGKVITPIKYDKAEDFRHGIGIVNVGGKWHEHFYGGKYGLVNTEGKEISEIKYDLIKHFDVPDNNLMLVNMGAKWDPKCPCTRGGKWAIFDNNKGKEVTEFLYEAFWINEGLENVYTFQKDGKYGLINEKGENLVPNIYDNISYYSEIHRFRVTANKMSGLIDEQGNIIVPMTYGWLDYTAHKNQINVRKDGRTFIIDANGVEIK